MEATQVLSPSPVSENTTDTDDPQRGAMRVKLEVEGFEPCLLHAPESCDCPKVSVGKYCNDGDLTTQQFAQFVLANIFATTQTPVKDTSNTSRNIPANTAASAVTIVSGTNTTAATVTDVVMGTAAETVAAAMSAYTSTSSTGGTFTITGTVTATTARAYTEVGIDITAATFTFLLCHDTFSVLNVSSSGTLAVTYTITLT